MSEAEEAAALEAQKAAEAMLLELNLAQLKEAARLAEEASRR